MHDSFDVAVIGAGASGTLLAAQWRRHAPAGARLALVEAGARAARGLAYGAPYGAMLLNVPAGRMSAFTEAPGHFHAWLKTRLPGADETTFAPRPLYGEYLAAVLEAAADGPGLVRINAAAVGLTRDADRWRIHLRDGGTLDAGSVVLALGNFPPADPLGLGETAPDNYLRGPWAPGAAAGLPEGGAVLLIGTGLTMVDLALVLEGEGRCGVIHALSRHGRLSQAHAPAQPSGAAPDEQSRRSARGMVRWLRRELHAARQAGRDWRGVIDGLRPHVSAIWSAWSQAERGRFIRHARNLWEVHRHRMAPDVAARVERMRQAGRLIIHRGRIDSLEEVSGRLCVRWRSPAGSAPESLTVDRVINCTGPATDYARLDLPLIVSLRRGGWLRPDRFRLGIDTDADGRLIGASGGPIAGLFTLGPLRKGTLWESTAIPEIRVQAAALAELLAKG